MNPYKKGNDTFDASNAVDGLKSNLHWSGGQCAISALEEETATWWVHLGRIHSIHHITLYYRTENDYWGKIKLPNFLFFIALYFLLCIVFCFLFIYFFFVLFLFHNKSVKTRDIP